LCARQSEGPVNDRPLSVPEVLKSNVGLYGLEGTVGGKLRIDPPTAPSPFFIPQLLAVILLLLLKSLEVIPMPIFLLI
jgi:hypothetical protein